jgi:hypothetical protein
MKSLIRTSVLVLLLMLFLVSCEMMFTTSPVAFLQRNAADLSPEQQVAFGRDALASGDEATMAEAYEALKETDDPETQVLAAELALGAAGLETALTEALGELSGGGDTDAILAEALGSFTAEDLVLMNEAAALLNAAEESVTPTPEQYAFAAIGLMAVAIDANGGTTDGLSTGGSPEVAQAEAFLQAAAAGLQANGETTDLLDDLLAVIQTS